MYLRCVVAEALKFMQRPFVADLPSADNHGCRKMLVLGVNLHGCQLSTLTKVILGGLRNKELLINSYRENVTTGQVLVTNEDQVECFMRELCLGEDAEQTEASYHRLELTANFPGGGSTILSITIVNFLMPVDTGGGRENLGLLKYFVETYESLLRQYKQQMGILKPAKTTTDSKHQPPTALALGSKPTSVANTKPSKQAKPEKASESSDTEKPDFSKFKTLISKQLINDAQTSKFCFLICNHNYTIKEGELSAEAYRTHQNEVDKRFGDFLRRFRKYKLSEIGEVKRRYDAYLNGIENVDQ